ncbi:putative helicase [Bernardetia litoralis DSM 6794]|uniref:site-specific DNA-methyltransferase (adenine-specific) n=1 Tax=Bernardetia litoralis (strain ATCC 23117 / DSM 6794 / NBRC 15988 / NCIMB 1366 / Fx l1 / Sio-4) TaxID=880071 RepID=I4AI60_BERLS|nr:type ISP restriction/modification enzyme [Bernardetia litoralis]AFM03645.1 putative helicase [Bernardetia litoralis DSM 6794]
MTTKDYLNIVSKRFQSGISREHSYRGDLETLIRNLVQGIEITNEPANVTDCGNPDYVITNGKIPIGYIEAKDIDKDLNSKSFKEQFDRYKKALDNLIITDYISFQFFQNGKLIHEIRIADVDGNNLRLIPENYAKFENLIKEFCSYVGQTIKSSKKLAKLMAGKARLLQDILERAVTSDEKTKEDTSIKAQYDTFKKILIHDLEPTDFADIYAQTLAYGMFAARLHDENLNDFSRQKTAELIPKSNPFLRKLFGYVAGYDIDERIITVVDNLAEVFRATDIEQLLKNFGKSTQTNDPIIHFYETFLAEYDPKLRKAKGVWYTPEPVVNFIVRSVDEILKTEFGLPYGLADTSKTKIKIKTDIANKNFKSGYKEVEKEVHKVQILDPATGTGTFLAEVVKFIYNKNFQSMQGAWSGYVEEHLIPRLNGFELLMASYAMAHLKLDMLLTETGYKSKTNERLNIYLTNSLEEHHEDTGTLFSSWLSNEANEANYIKRDVPVMCVIGNPPYAVSSTNKGEWIEKITADYKKNLNERNIQPLSDDYIKFIRYGQHYIQKNGSGILAYISNNSFIDGIIHRQMRNNLLETFDKIYILDLHGNARKKEVSPDGSADQNVFDIMQGVSINIFVKTGKKKAKQLGKVYHHELFGKREAKYDFLIENSLPKIKWKTLKSKKPYYFFVAKNFELLDKFNTSLDLRELFSKNSIGIATGKDAELVDFTKDNLLDKYDIEPTPFYYRPFDTRFTIFDNKILQRARFDLMSNYLKGNIGLNIVRQSKQKGVESLVSKNITCKHLITGETYNFPLYLYPESPKTNLFSSKTELKKQELAIQLKALVAHHKKIDVFFHKTILPFFEKIKNLTQNEIISLEEHRSTYEESVASVEHVKEQLQNLENPQTELIPTETSRKPNLNTKIVSEVAHKLGLAFTNEKENKKDTFAPIDILDYIYAVLHSPTYREKYKEFLKIDFPRVPYPKDTKTFWELVKLGSEIREIHLLESKKIEHFITTYPVEGNDIITTKIAKKDWKLFDIKNQLGRIWINETQYFDNIPLVAWEFYIGGYQPAQKWLKDRTTRKLSFKDILHYQKIIVALSETDRIMKEIDKIEIE